MYKSFFRFHNRRVSTDLYFRKEFEESSPTPPTSFERITQDSQERITEDGNERVTQ